MREGQKRSRAAGQATTPRPKCCATRTRRLRGLFQPVEVPGAGALDMLVSPFHFDGAPLKLAGGPPVFRDSRMKPLAGIRIADFTVHNAGPFCTHLL